MSLESSESSTAERPSSAVVLTSALLCLLLARWSYHQVRARAGVAAAEPPPAEADGGQRESRVPWELASRHGELTAHTRRVGSEFHLRVRAAIHFGVAEMLAIPREFDLAPSWNHFCKAGELLELVSPTELVGIVVLALPRPLPEMAVQFWVKLHDRMTEERRFTCELHTVDEPAAPSWVGGARRLHIPKATLHLTPLEPPVGQSHHSSVEAEIRLDLERLALFANLVPLWAVNYALGILIPFTWRASLEVLARISQPESPIGRRLLEDETGVYSRVRRRAKQTAMQGGLPARVTHEARLITG